MGFQEQLSDKLFTADLLISFWFFLLPEKEVETGKHRCACRENGITFVTPGRQLGDGLTAKECQKNSWTPRRRF
jgi:hypothetical protein